MFQEAGLAKQSRQGKPRTEFFFLAFPSNPRLCPQRTLQAYDWRTEPFCTVGSEEQTRLFLAVVRRHKPVCSSTMARWLKSMLDKIGIDTSFFKAHSTRSAATSAAANAGITHVTSLKLQIGVVKQCSLSFITSHSGQVHLEKQSSPKVAIRATNYNSLYAPLHLLHIIQNS